MRVIAGSLRGHTFDSPGGHRTHPMSERIKGAIFNAVERKAGAYGYYGNYQYAYQSDAK